MNGEDEVLPGTGEGRVLKLPSIWSMWGFTDPFDGEGHRSGALPCIRRRERQAIAC